VDGVCVARYDGPRLFASNVASLVSWKESTPKKIERAHGCGLGSSRKEASAMNESAQSEDQPSERRRVLEGRFEGYLRADVEELTGVYNPTYFRRMLADLGGVGTAKLLLEPHRSSAYGFERLWELGQLERSLEFAVLLPWFSELFTDDELEEARRRLVLLDFDLDDRLTALADSAPGWVATLPD
jgi:hypothetical protein